MVEQIVGRRRYLVFYLAAGIVGALFFVGGAYLSGSVINGDRLFGTPLTPAVGASGALFGLLGLLAVLIPRQRLFDYWTACTYCAASYSWKVYP